MTPRERLLAEELPTGTFGGPLPGPPAPVTEKWAAANRAALEGAVYKRSRRKKPARHLTAVPDQPEPTQPKEHAA